MHNGRIEVYLHSDSSTPQKGGALLRIIAQTDFAARTDMFIGFCRHAAQLAYASGAADWPAVIAVFPDIETKRCDLEATLRERIVVDSILLLHL